MSLSHDERRILRDAREIKARERKRAKRERPKKVAPTAAGQRNVRKRYPGFLAWLRQQVCVLAFSGECEGPIDPAHIRTALPGELPTGFGRKPDDDRATPLCRGHHRKQHGTNELRFWASYGLDPFKVAAHYFAEFSRGAGAVNNPPAIQG